VFRSRGLTPDSDIYEPAARAKWLKQLPMAHRKLAQLLSERLEAAEQAQEQARPEEDLDSDHVELIADSGFEPLAIPFEHGASCDRGHEVFLGLRPA
jgi:hypothetical protein